MWKLVQYGREHPDDRSFVLVEYAAPDGCPLDDETAWKAANPALGDFLHIDALRATLKTTREPSFRRYRLGQWVGQVDRWLPWGAWDAVADLDREVKWRERIVLAFDGSASGDSTALVGCTMDGHLFTVGLWEHPAADPRGQRRADVVAKVRGLEETRDVGVVLTQGRPPTVGAWLTYWHENIAVTRLRPKTFENYGSNIRNHLVPHLGHHRLDRLQPEHVEAAWRALTDEGLSQATVLVNHRILSRGLKVAMQRGRVARNVATLVDAPTVARPEVVPLTSNEVRALLTAAAGVPNGARWSVALALGLRQGEALGLLWEDVDLEAGTLTVRRALQRVKGKGLVLVEPKSFAGRRTLALPPPLIDGLRRHRAAQLEQRMAAAHVWEDGGYVFAQPNGRPIGARADWGAWKRLLQVAGVRDARLHDARHTAATLLLQQGVAPRVAMQLLGHSQIAMTMHYTHVVPELARDAAARMGDALWGEAL
jgi:integrase